jgi:excisionase family DNA binding protein
MSYSESDFVTLSTAAERAAVSSRTVRRAVSRGELSAYHVGVQLRLKSTDVDLWLTSKPLVTVKT